LAFLPSPLDYLWRHLGKPSLWRDKKNRLLSDATQLRGVWSEHGLFVIKLLASAENTFLAFCTI